MKLVGKILLTSVFLLLGTLFCVVNILYSATIVCDTTSSLTIPGARNTYSMNFACAVPTGSTASLEISWATVGDHDGRDYFRVNGTTIYTTSGISDPEVKTTNVSSYLSGKNLTTGSYIYTGNAWSGAGGYYYGLAAGHSTMDYARLTVTYDDGPPLVLSSTPSDNSTTFNMTDDLVIYFDRDVTVGTGNITIKKGGDDSIAETIDVTSGQVTGDGTTVITINPSVDLSTGTAYYVQIDSTAFNDGGGNDYAGISNTTSWNFTTLDITPPTSQATDLTFTSVGTTGLTLGWSGGNGNGSVVFAKQADTGTATPVDYTNYTASATFGSGDQIGSSGWYTIYSGTGSNVAVTNLSAETVYIFHVVEYNTTAGQKTYFTDEATNNPKVAYITSTTYETTSSLNVPGGRTAYSMNFGVTVPSSATASLAISWATVGDHDGRDYFKCNSSILYTTSGISDPEVKTSNVTSCVSGQDLSTGTRIHTNNAWNMGGFYYGGAVHSTLDYARLIVTDTTDAPTTYTLTYVAGDNGTLTGSSSQTITEGSDGTAVTAVADDGYEFVEWNDSSTDNPRTDTSVTADATYTATFTLTDSTAPTISSRRATAASNGATISWSTDESASTQLEYGLTTSYGNTTAEANTDSRVTSHSVDLSNFRSCAMFHYRTRSTDANSNLALGEDATFTTAGCTGSATVLTQTSSSAATTTESTITLREDTANVALTIPRGYNTAALEYIASLRSKQL